MGNENGVGVELKPTYWYCSKQKRKGWNKLTQNNFGVQPHFGIWTM